MNFNISEWEKRHFLLGFGIALYWTMLYVILRSHDSQPIIFALTLLVSASVNLLFSSTINKLPQILRRNAKNIFIPTSLAFLITTNYWQVIILFAINSIFINLIIGQVIINQSNTNNCVNRFLASRQAGLVFGYFVAALFHITTPELLYLAPLFYWLSNYKINYHNAESKQVFGIPFLLETIMFTIIIGVGTTAWSQLAIDSKFQLVTLTILQGSIHVIMCISTLSMRNIIKINQRFAIAITLCTLALLVWLSNPFITFSLNGLLVMYWQMSIQHKAQAQLDGRRANTTVNSTHILGNMTSVIIQV